MLGCAGLGLGTGQLQTASEQRETVLPGYRLSDKTFLATAGAGVQEACGQLVRTGRGGGWTWWWRSRGKVDSERNPARSVVMGGMWVEKREEARVSVTLRALSWATWEHGGAIKRGGTRESPACPSTPQAPHLTPLCPLHTSYLSWVPSARPATKT